MLLLLIRRIAKDLLRRRATDREEARRAHVDVDAIEKSKWNGDQLAGDPHIHPDLAATIRAHIETLSLAERPKLIKSAKQADS